MKADRFTLASTRATAALLLACLLLAAGRPAAGQTITFRFGGKASKEAAMAAALAAQVKEVQKRFHQDRRTLRSVRGPGGEAAYARAEVAGLIVRAEQDLGQAIERVGEPGLEALRAWVAEEFRRIQEELAAPPGRTARLPRGLTTPRAATVFASLERLPLPRFASANTAARQETIPAAKSDRLLDQAGEVIGRIFLLAERNDLEVKLWVGSTPAPRATFRFWAQGQVKGSTPAPLIIQTNSKRDRVLRGLYSYHATLAKGPVAELIAYPDPTGASAARTASERLDLVKGSSFFCCRFDKQHCHHVTREKECRP